jgi:hypothetical protein
MHAWRKMGGGGPQAGCDAQRACVDGPQVGGAHGRGKQVGGGER